MDCLSPFRDFRDCPGKVSVSPGGRWEGCFLSSARIDIRALVVIPHQGALSRDASQDDISAVFYDLNAKPVLVSTCFW